MALSQQRIGELAMIFLQDQTEKEGVRLNPGEIKRDATNAAKRLKLPPAEVAEFMMLIIKSASERCMAELSLVQATE